MSKSVSYNRLQSSSIKTSFITNPFGRYFSYYNKHVKVPPVLVHHKLDGPLISSRSFRSISPISSLPSVSYTQRPSSISRSGSSSKFSSQDFPMSSSFNTKPQLRKRPEFL